MILLAIKILHASILILVSLCMAYILYCGLAKKQNKLLIIAVLIPIIEGIALFLNNWECPLADLARKYGDPQGHVAGIFFPEWFLPHLFEFYTLLFIIGIILVIKNFKQQV